MRAACECLIEPITETMLDLLARRARVPGEGAPEHHPLRRQRPDPRPRAALQKALKDFGGGQVRVVKDPIFDGSDGGLALALDAPASDWDKLAA